MYKLIILFCSITLATLGLAQENTHKQAYQQGFDKGYMQGQQEALARAKQEYKELQKSFDQELNNELNKMEALYMAEMAKQQEDFQKAFKERGEIPTTTTGTSLYKKAQLAEVLNQSTSEIMQNALIKLRELSDEEIEQNILAQISKDSFFGELFLDHKSVKTFVINIIRDKEALPHLGKIVEEKENNIWYLALNFVVAMGFFIFNKFFAEQVEDASFFDIKELLKKGLQFSLHFGLLIYFFGPNLYPTLKVFMNAFF